MRASELLRKQLLKKPKTQMKSKFINDEIAIIGMACKLPGKADSLANFQNVLMNGREVTGPIPKGRFGRREAAIPKAAQIGGYLAQQPWGFDAAAFGIAPREASYMDPQHRLLLEVCYHAIEDAGIDPSSLRGKRCGVFVGISTSDFARQMTSSGDYNGFLSRGALGSMASGRISYHFGLEGPSIVVDTACSSSLVSLHQALTAMADDRCDMAIVAGASLLLAHDYTIDLAAAGMLASDGRCKPFTRHADGFARGEGVGAVFLLPAPAAVAAGHRIYANLVASAVNSDGRSNGITAPSQRAQRGVIEEALNRAGISADDVSFVETHGTGTDLGDRIELAALAEVFGRRTTPLYLGAVKANIAHCEGAAGIVSVIKCALSIHSGMIAPHCMADDIADSPVLAQIKGVFPRRPVEWSVVGRRIAGISSFGMSGTNAHVIAAAPLHTSEECEKSTEICAHTLLYLSARTQESMDRLAQSYLEILERDTAIDVHALASASLLRRQHWSQCRLAVAGSNAAELAYRLRERISTGAVVEGATRIVMLFTGQGSQYTNMSRELYESSAMYRRLLDHHAQQLDRIAGMDVSILSTIFTPDPTSRLSGELANSQRVAQLSIFLVEYTLAQLWIELGCKPVVALGHSVGEYAAACIAGVMNFETAIRMLIARADAMEMACRSQPSSMLAISATADDVAKIVRKTNSEQPSIWLAVCNSWNSYVVGGLASTVSVAQENAEAEGLICAILATQGAFHTPLMQSAAAEFEISCSTLNLDLSPPSGEVQFLSSVQGRTNIAAHEVCKVSYWRDQITQPVDFESALQAILDEKSNFILEVGPHAVLTAFCASEIRRSGDFPRCSSSLDQRRKDMDSMLSALAGMCERGILNARTTYTALTGSSYPGPALTLPSYPFQRDVFKPTSWESTSVCMPSPVSTLGVELDEFHVRHMVSLDLERVEDAWMTQHQINDQVVLPGAFYIASAYSLAERWLPADGRNIRLTNIEIGKPLILSPGASTAKMVFDLTGPDKANCYQIKYRDIDSDGKPFAAVTITKDRRPANTPLQSPTIGEDWQSAETFYDRYAERGVTYGSLFRRINRFQSIAPMHVVCEIEALVDGQTLLVNHPGFIDSCLQTLGICARNIERAFVPVSINEVILNQGTEGTKTVFCNTQLTSADELLIEGNITIYSKHGELLGQLLGVVCVGIMPDGLKARAESRKVDWVLKSNLQNSNFSKKDGTWLLFASEHSPDFESLTREALEAGIQTQVVFWRKNGELHKRSAANYGELTQVDTIVFLAPKAALPLDANYSSLALLLRSIRDCLEAVLNQQPGHSVKFCVVDSSDTPNDLFELTWGAMLKAIAVNLPSEFPNLRVAYLAMPGPLSQLLAAVSKVLNQSSEIERDELETCFWKVQDSQFWRRQTVPEKRINEVSGSFQCRPDGRYLVTGAFGGVGRHIVKFLIEDAGCRHLILLASGPLSVDAAQWLEGIRSVHSSTEIDLRFADLTDTSNTESFLSGLNKPLQGIFHLAGINVDRPIANTDAEQLAKVIDAKLGGAWALHCYAARHSELEYFVLFSSLASLVPSPGQLVYALANAGLQDLAEHRRSLGLPAMVIDWGPWADTGMMKGIREKSHSAALRHFSSMLPARASEAFGGLMSLHTIDKASVHFAVYEKSSERQKKTSADELVHAKLATPADLLSELISTETGHPVSALDESLTLDQLGLDSISVIRIRGELQSRLKLVIPAAIFLNGTTICDLRKYLDDLDGTITDGVVEAKPDAAVAMVPARLPMSYNQFSLWYEQNRDKQSYAYNCAIGWKLEMCQLHRHELEARWAQLVADHELLRATFDDGEGAPDPSYLVHSVSATLKACPVYYLSVKSVEDVLLYARSLIEEPPQLTTRFPTKVSFVETSDHHTYLLLSSNHLVMDASTIFIVGVQLLEAVCGRQSIPVSRTAPYHEFVHSQRATKADEQERAYQYFNRRLLTEEGEIIRMELQGDIPLLTDKATGGISPIPLSQNLVQAMAAFPANRRAALCLSAWVLLLSRYSGQSRVVTGVAFNGRSQQRWRHTVGHFVNVLPLVVDVDETLPTAEFLNSVLNALFEMVDYQDIPLASIMSSEKLKVAHHSTDVLQSYFNFFDASEMNIEAGETGSIAIPLHIPQQEAQFDLSLWVTQYSGSWRMELKYRNRKFSESLAAQIARHYSQLLEILAQAETEKSHVLQLPMLQQHELKQLEDGHGPVDYEKTTFSTPLCSSEQRVHEAFELQAQSRPASIAIEWGSHTLDYGTLDRVATELAAVLRAQGIGKEHTVGLLLPRFGCPETIIAVLAIWKCDAAYVALDMRHPPSRVAYMVTTARCSLVLTGFETPKAATSSALESISGLGLVRIEFFVSLAELSIKILRNAVPKRMEPLMPNSEYADRDGLLAYVLFTSGSTGNPKGVLVEHRGLTERLSWMADYFSFTSEDRFLQGTVLTFDVSVPEFCLPLMYGGTIVLFAADDSPTSHARVCSAHGVTLMSTVPSLLNVLLDELVQCSSLRHLISVGEALMRPVVEQWLSSGTQAVLHNLYGPTEATIYATFHACKAVPQSPGVSIGRACPGVLCWVLDKQGRPVPPGVAGELYLGGSGVARGYIGTVRSPDPFFGNPYQTAEKRIYRTGDIVKWAKDGGLEYIGRNDFRVKFRGQLVELGEIEHVLMEQPEIKHAAAFVVRFDSGKTQIQQIVACVISSHECEATLRAALQTRLPEYMVPSRIFCTDEFPLNGSGKVDRKNLQSRLQERLRIESESREVDVATELSDAQRRIQQIWEEILNVRSIGTRENFFQLGGDSLSLTRLVFAVERALKVKVDFGRFVRNPTIDGLIEAGVSTRAVSS